tara:strand:+ start:13083 stop:14006 length:924 start_codon:yes stop_codon:yes gene_type:complete
LKYKNGNIKLSKGKQVLRNYLNYDNEDYVLSNLENSIDGRTKGGNSNVFKITNANTQADYVIKVCKYDLNRITPFSEKRISRFSREIEALEASQKNGFNRIISIVFNGDISIGNRKFSYYVMEEASYDLTYFLNNFEISIQEKFSLCIEILAGLSELHSIGVYHRDIKPDNILYTPNGWKIGDLGLIDYRDSDFIIEEEGEKIGPIGWLSPEAANKFLCEGEGKINPYNHDCDLNYLSDVFQLGKLFWYIFQGNIPIGQIEESDFVAVKDKELFELLIKMLSYKKSKRFKIKTLEREFNKKSKEYAL